MNDAMNTQPLIENEVCSQNSRHDRTALEGDVFNNSSITKNADSTIISFSQHKTSALNCSSNAHPTATIFTSQELDHHSQTHPEDLEGDKLIDSEQRETLVKNVRLGQHENLQHTPYNPYMIPPNWELAEDHLKALSVGKDLSSNILDANQPIKVDELSGRPVHKAPLPLTTHRKDLAFLGPAYPMYYEFVIHSLKVLVIVFLFSGIFGIYTNVNGEFCREVTDENTEELDNFNFCPKTFNTLTSLANQRTDNAPFIGIDKIERIINLHSLQGLFDAVALLLLIVIGKSFHDLQGRSTQRLRNRDRDISNYTFRMKNIRVSPDCDVAEEIRNFINRQDFLNKTVQIRKISLCYNFADKLALEQKIEKLLRQKARVIKQIQTDGTLAQEEVLQKKIKEAREAVQQIEKDFENNKSARFLGVAYVTLNSRIDCQAIIQKWRTNCFCRALIGILPNNWFPRLNGKPVWIDEAEAPSSVFWENLGVSYWKKILIRTITSGICSAILIVCALLIGVMNSIKVAGGKITSSEFKVQFALFAITNATSIIIMIVNFLLRFVVSKLSLFERIGSWTHYYTIVARRLAAAEFLNTAISLSITSHLVGDFWGAHGTIMSITSYFQLQAILPAFFELINYDYWVGVYKRRRAKSQGENCTLTQQEAMLLYENPETNFAAHYAFILKSVIIALFSTLR